MCVRRCYFTRQRIGGDYGCRAEAAGLRFGRIFRAMPRGDRVTAEAMTPHSIYAVLTENATEVGLTLAPHDLRCTHAKLAHSGGSRVEQIQLALGHSSIQRLSGISGPSKTLGDASCDRLGITVGPEISKQRTLGIVSARRRRLKDRKFHGKNGHTDNRRSFTAR